MRQRKALIWFHCTPGFISFLVSIALGISCSAGVVPREEEGYLRGTQGPYRGRVIDAGTKKPIPGAVVVAVWHIDMPALVQRNSVFYDAVEVLTDAEGYFVVDAPEIERRAPPNTEFPDFTIFKPGYRHFQGWLADPEPMAQRRIHSVLRVVELEPMKGKSHRERLMNLPPNPVASDVPAEKIPNFLKALTEERKALGLGQ